MSRSTKTHAILIGGVFALSAGAFSSMPAAAGPDPQSAAQVGHMHNQCGHPNYQGDPARCRGGQSSSWSGEYDYFYQGLAVTQDGKPYFYRHHRLSARSSSAPEWFFEDLEQLTMAKCKQSSGNDCRYVAGTANSCVVVARNADEDVSFWADGHYQQCRAVRKKALETCRSQSKQNPDACRVVGRSKSPGFWNR